MSARAREVELLLLSMFAAVPLYGTQTISTLPLLAYHLVIAGITARVISNRSPQLVPEPDPEGGLEAGGPHRLQELGIGPLEPLGVRCGDAAEGS